MDRELAASAWKPFATRLGVEEAVLRAVAEVESAGSGFLPLPSQQPTVLFEGHAFHRLTGGRFDAAWPTLSHRAWDPSKYSGSRADEWTRLEAAIELDRTAALQSASWGMFQIMGFNYGACGLADVEAFVAAQSAGAASQLQVFVGFIARAPYLKQLRGRDWAGFAASYNGPGYRDNHYDTRLAEAYERLVGTGPVVAAAAMPSGRSEFPVAGKPRKRVEGRNVKPDSVDLRDWIYRANIAVTPDDELLPNDPRPIKQQSNSNACTGFALSTVIETLLDRAKRPTEPVSGYMLYSMARRYDEWAENDSEDSGSSIRGALKGWSRHGASSARLWKKLAMPKATNKPDSDWWMDAINRPMGAYYRLAKDSITDVQIALVETGAIYASAMTHAGWDALMGDSAEPPATVSAQLKIIERHAGDPEQGHAFAVVGYTRDGFIVQNSWGPTWGRGGFGVLRYADWLENIMDCWVVQLGAVTTDHTEAAREASLRFDARAGRVALPGAQDLVSHQVDAFVIDMENEGRLSSSGRFRTCEDDLRALVEDHLPRFLEQHAIAADAPIDIALYAHGGLVDEKAADAAARTWIPWLYQNRIFPIFLMWETGALKTLGNIIEDARRGEVEHVVGGFWRDVWNRTRDFIDARLESVLRKPGRKLWEEMKQNADATSSARNAGLVLLFKHLLDNKNGSLAPRARLHLVGHSAGSILHTHLMPRAIADGFQVATLNLMAPAVTTELFDKKLAPLLANHDTRIFIAHLTDTAEAADNCAVAYGHSLLYLVSRSFEQAADTPILGMEKYLAPTLASHAWGGRVQRLASPDAACPADPAQKTRARHHGDMDNDKAVQWAIVRHIHGQPI